MRIPQIWAFCLTAAAFTCSAGQPYKCVGADGKVTFTDQKCDAQAQPQRVWDSHLGAPDPAPETTSDAAQSAPQTAPQRTMSSAPH